MQPLKLAYEWIGPAGPISNNDYPNLYELKRQYNYQHNDYDYPVRTANLKDLLADIYDTKVTPVCNIKDDDFFLYEVNLDYKNQYAFDSFYANNTTARIKHLLNYGRGYYAFNACLEGWCGNHWFMDRFYEVFSKNKINPKKVIYFTGAVNGQALHDEWARSRGVDVNNYINIISCDHYSTMRKQRIMNRKSRPKKFVSFNRRWKPHRILLYIFLHKNNLLEHFYFSMPKDSVTNPGESFHSIAQDASARFGMDFTIDDINAAFNDLPLVLDNNDFGGGLNWWDSQGLSQYHSNSYVSIVTETFFEEREVFPTEKVFRPMSIAQPFIALSTTGYLEGLRTMGFQTFPEQFDESYDKIVDSTQRLKTVFNMIKDMCEWSEDQFEEMVYTTQLPCLHNYHIVGTNVPRLITRNQLDRIINDNR